nr:creatininase family protein [Halomarina sp. BND7]
MRLAAQTTTTFRDAACEVAPLPTGGTEQHGPALPFGTDHLAAEALVRAVERDDAAGGRR